MIQLSNSKRKYAVFFQLGLLGLIVMSLWGGYTAILHYKILIDDRHSFLKMLSISAILPIIFIRPIYIATKSSPSLPKENENRTLNQLRLIFSFIGLLVLSWGGVTTINAVLDKSPVHLYKVKVLSKREWHGRTTSYDLIVTSWSVDTKERRINLSHFEYDSLDVNRNDYVNIGVKDGAFGFKWISSITKADDKT